MLSFKSKNLASRPLKRKSFCDNEPDVIDLSDSPDSQTEFNNFSDRNSKSSAKEAYSKDYFVFDRRLQRIEEDKINRAAFKRDSELKLECIKYLLNDWIFFTSKDTTCSHLSSREINSKIDADDLLVFKHYLMYLLHVSKDLEHLVLIMRVFKRLILKNGSLEWTETYREMCASIQADFYEKYDSTIKFD